jgi:hypothetical protein
VLKAPTCTGDDLSIKFPDPNCPCALDPHAHKVSSVLIARTAVDEPPSEGVDEIVDQFVKAPICIGEE